MTRGIGFLRLVLSLSLAGALVYSTNLDYGVFGGFEKLVASAGSLFAAAVLSALALICMWWGSLLRMAQSKSRSVLVELAVAVVLLLAATAFFGVVATPLNLCFGGSGGYVCYPSLVSFASGVADLLALVVAEELFFRAYLINEVDGLVRLAWGGAAISALIYSLYHLPALVSEGYRAFSMMGFTLILLGAFTLSFCYWYTSRNLAATILLHGYWDGISALFFIPNIGPSGPVVVMLGGLTLPALGVVVAHQLLRRASRGRREAALALAERSPNFIFRQDRHRRNGAAQVRETDNNEGQKGEGERVQEGVRARRSPDC